MKGKNPLIPMGAITGRPDRKRIEEVLSSYKSVGIEQFLIYPRTGLEIEYMSDEWMEMCKNAVEIAASLDMHIWLYDEYNFPSGNCRGQVTEGHDEYYPNALVFEKLNNSYTARVVRNRIGSDILNPDVVARFVALTHERYYSAFSSYFGTVIQGIYTDEPSFAYFSRLGTFAEEVGGESFRLPWYGGLEEDYAALEGRNLRSDVISHLNGHTPEKLWEHYYRIMGQRMRKVYIGEIARWCEAHGILLTGHLMEERADTCVRFNGNPLKMLKTFPLPGMDETASRHTLSLHNMELSALSLVQYASREKQCGLAELFSVSPTDMPLGEMRTVLWMTACFGVDHYVTAVAALDPKGNVGKPCYYYPVSKTNPNFIHYPALVETAKKAAKAARRGYSPEVRFRFPSTYLMRCANTPEEAAAGRRMIEVLEGLVSHQIQYLYLDEDEETDLPVFSLNEKGFFMEGSDACHPDAEEFCDYLCGVLPRRITVFENGVETRDILVRLWDGGVFTLVDLSGDKTLDRFLTVRVGDFESRVRLPGNGVFDGQLPPKPASPKRMLEPSKVSDIRIELEKENLLRLSYTMEKPEIRLFAQEDIPGVRLILRNDPDPVMFSLDGEEIPCECPDDRLPDGFSPLYRASIPFTVKKGEHVFCTLPGNVRYEYVTSSVVSGVYDLIKYAPAGVDCRFLPAAFLCGTFACERNEDASLSLSAYTGRGSLGPVPGAPDYIGDLIYTMKIQVPDAKNRYLSLNTDCVCTGVWLDDENLGTRTWAPWEWKVPDEFSSGTHVLRVRITTTVRPMFGDLNPYLSEQPYWRSIRVTTGRKTGLLFAPVWLCEQ